MTPSLLAIAVNAHIEQNETHIPEIVHSRKNLAKDVFISLNLLSSPAFFILKNKKLPSLTAHKITRDAKMILPNCS